jgi:uncharacterized membrane protein (Fun14 family)
MNKILKSISLVAMIIAASNVKESKALSSEARLAASLAVGLGSGYVVKQLGEKIVAPLTGITVGATVALKCCGSSPESLAVGLLLGVASGYATKEVLSIMAGVDGLIAGTACACATYNALG